MQTHRGVKLVRVCTRRVTGVLYDGGGVGVASEINQHKRIVPGNNQLKDE